MDPEKWRTKKAKKTLREVAALLGCSSLSSVQRYERGEREAPTSISLGYEAISKDEKGAALVTAEDLAAKRRSFLRRTKEA